MTAMISFVGATTANATAPVIASTSTIPNGTVDPSITITTSSGPFSSANTTHWSVDPDTTGLIFYSIGTNGTTVTISFRGTATCSGTATIQAKASAFSSQTLDSNILSFAVTGSTCSTDATLSGTSTIKGATINSFGTPNNLAASVVRGSVTLTSTQAADTSNSGAFVTNFIKNNADASSPVVRKAPAGTALASITSSFSYNGTAAVSDGDIFLVRISPRAGTTLTYVIDVTISSGGGSSSAPSLAACSADLLSSSSTFKGVAITLGQSRASAQFSDFYTPGPLRGSVNLTEAQATGSGTTSMTTTDGSAVYWLYIAPGVNSFSHSDISGTSNQSSESVVSGRDFIVRVVPTTCAEQYYWLTINVGSSNSGQGSQQNAQAQAAAAQAQAAAVLATAIAKAKIVLTTQFVASKPATLGQFLDAGYGVRNENIAAKASAAILKLSATDREKTEKIIEIINREDFIDRVSMTDTRSTVKSTDLISRGLLPANNVHKHSVIRGLGTYPNGSLDTMAKIEDAIKEQIFKAEAPKRRLAEIKAKIAARKK